MTSDDTQPLELWDVDECCAFWGGKNRPISKATLYRLIKAGSIPGPVRVAPNCSRFVAREQRAALAARINRS